MGLEFTTILSGDTTTSIADIAKVARAEFAAGGFSGGRRLLRCSFEAEREVYDEVFPEQEFKLEDATLDAPYAWDGWATEYLSDGATFYVIVGRNPSDGTVNAWLDVSQRAVSELWQEGKFARYLASLCALARAIGASAGYGHGSLDFHLLSAVDATASIESMPEYPGEPSSVGLLSSKRCSLTTAKEKWGKHFAITQSTSGYLLLVHRDFEARYG